MSFGFQPCLLISTFCFPNFSFALDRFQRFSFCPFEFQHLE
jgi:hypothetical protein